MVAPTYLYLTYLHFGKGLGLERGCAFTRTVFGPGFALTRVGRHFVLVAMRLLL